MIYIYARPAVTIITDSYTRILSITGVQETTYCIYKPIYPIPLPKEKGIMYYFWDKHNDENLN